MIEAESLSHKKQPCWAVTWRRAPWTS